MVVDRILAAGLIPDFLIRLKIKKLLLERLEESKQFSLEPFVIDLSASAIAIGTTAANEQHYELPTEFYKLCLGKNMKYSGSLDRKSTRLNSSHSYISYSL